LGDRGGGEKVWDWGVTERNGPWSTFFSLNKKEGQSTNEFRGQTKLEERNTRLCLNDGKRTSEIPVRHLIVQRYELLTTEAQKK